jgi:transcriptional regulator of acetoin/glycerol metabolism
MRRAESLAPVGPDARFPKGQSAMDVLGRAERRTLDHSSSDGTWEELRRRYHLLEASLGLDIWGHLEGKVLEADIRARAVAGPLLIGRAVFSAPRSVASAWDVMNEAEVGTSNVFLVGERGVGKEEAVGVLANTLRKEVVSVNCALLGADIAEAILFGIEGKAGFETTKEGSTGFVQHAQGGILFLDEFLDAPPSVLPKLLRLLQQRVFARVGGPEESLKDTVIAAASNRFPTRTLLREATASKETRADVIDRFGAVLEVPALRIRVEELPMLAEMLLRRAWEEGAVGERPFPFHSLSERSKRLLQTYPYSWPGNLRELDTFLRQQGKRRRHDTAQRDVLDFDKVAMEGWLAGAPQVVTGGVSECGCDLSAWDRRKGLPQLRERQLVAAIQVEAARSGVAASSIDVHWVTTTCGKLLGGGNVSQRLRDGIGKTAMDLLAVIRSRTGETVT